MRLVVLGCVLLAGAPAFAQPTPDTPDPAPGPPPNPNAPAPDPNAPVPPDPNAPPPDPTPPPPTTSPTPTPPPTPVAVEPPVPKTARQTATEARLAAQAQCAAHEPCDWAATLSSLERASLRRRLADLGLELDPTPWGKVISRVRVENEDVFAEKNWLRLFNIFHVTTKRGTIRSEIVVEDGEVWSDERVLEASRRVRDPLYTSVVVMVPVKSKEHPDTVELLVVTRDIWSLRLNTKWDINGDNLRGFTMSLSENNFLGRRKTVAIGFNMDQAAIATGPLYIDKNFLGQHIDLRTRVDRIFTRKSLDAFALDGTFVPTGDPGGIQDDRELRAEGTTATLTVAKQLWSLSSKWGWGAGVSYADSISRSYLFTGLRGYDDPSTMEIEYLPREYRMKTWSVRGSATRQWGDFVKHAVELGYSVGSQKPSLLDYTAFEVDPAVLGHFVDDVFPRDEVVSGPFVEYSLYLNKYGTVRNVDTYELAEDLRYGPSLTAGLSQTFKSLGSTYRFTRPSLSGSWTLPWGRDGFYRISAGGQLRIQEGRTLDNTATATVRATTPTLASYLRLLAQVHFETRWNDESNGYYTLGSDNGLRAYNVAQVFGDRRILGQIEARSVPFPIWVVRVGGVVFYEGGGTANSFGQMHYLHDVGFGARMLIPQSSRELFRFDLAFPLTTAQGAPAGHPRFLAGFDSYF